MITPEAVIAAARSALGTPFVAQGRSKEEGLDCVGLLLWSFQQAGWEPLHPETTLDRKYRIANDGRQLMRVAMGECVQIVTNPKPADIVLIRWREDYEPMHAAIVWKADPLYIIHTSLRAGKVSDHRVPEEQMWKVHSAWRCRALC